MWGGKELTASSTVEEEDDDEGDDFFYRDGGGRPNLDRVRARAPHPPKHPPFSPAAAAAAAAGGRSAGAGGSPAGGGGSDRNGGFFTSIRAMLSPFTGKCCAGERKFQTEGGPQIGGAGDVKDFFVRQISQIQQKSENILAGVGVPVAKRDGSGGKAERQRQGKGKAKGKRRSREEELSLSGSTPGRSSSSNANTRSSSGYSMEEELIDWDVRMEEKDPPLELPQQIYACLDFCKNHEGGSTITTEGDLQKLVDNASHKDDDECDLTDLLASPDFFLLEKVKEFESRALRDVMNEVTSYSKMAHREGSDGSFRDDDEGAKSRAVYFLVAKGRAALGCQVSKGDVDELSFFDPIPHGGRGPLYGGVASRVNLIECLRNLFLKDKADDKFRVWILRSRYSKSGPVTKDLRRESGTYSDLDDAAVNDPKYAAVVAYSKMMKATAGSDEDEDPFAGRRRDDDEASGSARGSTSSRSSAKSSRTRTED